MSNSYLEFCDVLNIKASRDILEIITALVESDSFGTIDLDKSMKIYFDPKSKNRITKMISDFKEIYEFSYSWQTLKMEPWHLQWKDNFNPIYVQNQIVVIPDWQDKNLGYPINIRIKPGMAFGTGHHETTYLMLEALIRHPIKEKSVLDFGTGSGILAIASRKLGANKVVGVDYDDLCKENFHENISLNKCDQIPFFCMDAIKWNNLDFDYILANINRNILLDLIPNFKNITGKLFLSGILENDEEIIMNSCYKNGLKIEHTFQKGEWLMMEICNDA